MNISASDLKHVLKKLSPVRSDTYQIGGGFISTQDSDVWVVTATPLQFSETFNIAGKKLTQCVNRMSGQIDIEREGNKLILTSARKKIELEVHTIKPPVFPKFQEKFPTFKSEEFKAALSIAQAAAETKKAAQHGDVVQFRSLPLGIEDERPAGYVLVGSDANRLTVVSQVQPLLYEFTYLLNLEAAACVQLMDGDLSVGETNTNLQFQAGETTVYAAKPQKSYPDYTKFLPPSTEFKIGFEAEELLSALRTVEPLIDETVYKGAIGLHIKDNVIECVSLAVCSTASDCASYEQLEPDPVFDPKEIHIKLAAKYLSGFASKASGQMTMSFLGVTKPVKMEHKNITSIVMPFGKV